MTTTFSCVCMLLVSLLLYTKSTCWASHRRRFVRGAQGAAGCSSARSVRELHACVEGRTMSSTTAGLGRQHRFDLAASHAYCDTLEGAQGAMPTCCEQKNPTKMIALQALRGSRLLTGSRLATTSCSSDLLSSSRKLALDPSLGDATHRDDLAEERFHDQPVLATPDGQVVSRDRQRSFTARGCASTPSLDEHPGRTGCPLHGRGINPVHSGSSTSVWRAKKKQICLADVFDTGDATSAKI